MLHRRGISLIEVLVVIAILAIVFGLLVPAISSVRSSGRIVRCLANVRSLQLASISYCNDHRGLLIDVGLPHGGTSYENIAWINTLEPYYGTRSVLRSPLDNSPHWPNDLGGLGVPLPNSTGKYRRTSYGCNNYLSRTFSPLAATDPETVSDRLSRIPGPASTIHFLLMAETGSYAGSDHVHVESWWVNQAAKNLPPTKAASQMKTHASGGPQKSWDSRANYGFVDGSSETRTFASVYLNKSLNRFDPSAAADWPALTASSPEN